MFINYERFEDKFTNVQRYSLISNMLDSCLNAGGGE